MIALAALTFLLIIATIISFYFKQDLAISLPSSVFVVVIFLYVFGSVNYLSQAFLILIFGVIALLIYTLFKKNLIKAPLVNQLLSPGLVFFYVGSAFTFFKSKGMQFYEWDEFSHWGPAVKSMFLFDELGPYSPAELVFPEYPPGLSIFSYFLMKLNGSWDESITYWSHHLVIISIFSALIANFKRKSSKLIIVFSIALLALSSVMFFNSFQSLYADHILGIVFGYALYQAKYQIDFNKKASLFNFLFTILFLSLIKEIGLFFCFVVIIYALALVWSRSENRSTKKIKLKVLLSFCLVILSLGLLNILWFFALSFNGIVKTRGLTSSLLDTLLNLVQGSFSDHNKQVFVNFVSNVFNSPLTEINYFSLSTFHWILIFSGIFFVAVRSDTESSVIGSVSHKISNWIPIAGIFVYLLVLVISYFSFSTYEALELASYERYVTTYLCGLAIFICSIVLHSMATTTPKFFESNLLIVWLLLLLMQASPYRILTFATDPTAYSTAFRSKYEYLSRAIHDLRLSEKDRVWIIAQHSTGFEHFFYKYQSLPAKTGNAPWSIGSIFGPEDIWTNSSMTPAVWEHELTNYDYVIIYNVSDSFINEFGRLFENPNELPNSAIYRVIKNIDGNKLVKVS